MQILVEEAQYRRVEQEARRRGGSVASVIRDAVDVLLADAPAMTPAQAADILLDAEPIDVGDWVDMKEELVDLPRAGT